MKSQGKQMRFFTTLRIGTPNVELGGSGRMCKQKQKEKPTCSTHVGLSFFSF